MLLDPVDHRLQSCEILKCPTFTLSANIITACHQLSFLKLLLTFQRTFWHPLNPLPGFLDELISQDIYSELELHRLTANGALGAARLGCSNSEIPLNFEENSRLFFSYRQGKGVVFEEGVVI